MLQRIGEHVTACFDRAREADERAAQTDDPKQIDEHFEMAARWRMLARSYQYVESLERFLLDAQKAKDALRPDAPRPVAQADPLPATSTPPCPRCGKPMRLATAKPTTPYVNVSEVSYVCDCGESFRTLMVHED